MPHDALRAALTAVADAKRVAADLELRRESLSRDRERAKDELDEAKAQKIRVSGALALGEVTEATFKHAKQAFEDAETRFEGLTQALKTVDERHRTALEDIAKAERRAIELAAPIAASLAKERLERVHKLADELGRAASEWSKLDNLSRHNSGFTTGEIQATTLGIRDILARHRVESTHVYVRHLEARDELTASELEAML